MPRVWALLGPNRYLFWEVDWIRWTSYLATMLPGPHLLDFLFWNHLKSLVYETPVATVEDFTYRIVVASADMGSTLDLFERVQQSFVRRLCHELHCRNFKQFL
ncbi:hypothetical protein TNCV_3229521 [Trichonephila clavipes]|nr:hypothetical protein TNCV_3229521 [Trichonephila clavipes]